MNKDLTTIILNIFFLVAILLACTAIFQNYSDTDLSVTLSVYIVVLIFAVSAINFSLVSFSWALILHGLGARKGLFIESAAQTSIMLMSKYIPGKVWGMTAKVIMCRRLEYPLKMVLGVTVFEQFYSLGIALILGLAFAIAGAFEILLGLLVLTVVFLPPLVLKSKMLAKVLNVAGGWLPESLFRNLEEAVSAVISMSYSRLFIYTSTCIVSWLSVFVVIALLAGTMNFFPDLDFQAWCILFGAYALSVLAGFVAIFAPGGIFVREAAFCVLVSSILEYEYAIQLALVIRLWAVAYDIFFGVIGLLLVNSRLDLKVE